ncbi:MAG: hypothetical protein IJG45_08220 [Oscillospiraceae bacterium]|nr:hypothetical protein [Oscillospiraceae bacterium]
MKRILCLFLCLVLVSSLLCSQAAADEPDLLKNRGDQFVKDRGLTEEDFAVYFFDTKTRAEYVYNENTFFPVGSDWILPLHMYYYEQETLGAFNPPFDRPDDIYTIEGMTLEKCRYRSIINGEEEVARKMRDNLGTVDQYLTMINEKYGHIEVDQLPDSYYRSNCYSATFLMNCLKQVSTYPELYQDMMKNFSLVQTDDGVAGYDRPYNVVHIRSEQDGYICDLAEVSGPDTYLLVCFASEDVGGDTLLAAVNSMFCKYVEEINDVQQNTAPTGGGRQRSDSDFEVASYGKDSKGVLYRWIGMGLAGAAVVATIIWLIIRAIRRREDRRYHERDK